VVQTGIDRYDRRGRDGGGARRDVANGDVANGDVANGDVANGDVANGDVVNGDYWESIITKL
jgi:hypothetical protein